MNQIAPILLSALFWFLVMSLCGAACLVAGVALLAGSGWALIASGVIVLAAAYVIRLGMSGG